MNTPEKLLDFERELKSLKPWTPPVVVLRSAVETKTPQKRNVFAWPVWASGLLLGMLLGGLGGGLGSGFGNLILLKPQHVETVHHQEKPTEFDASPGSRDLDGKEKELEKLLPNGCGSDMFVDLDTLIESHNARAKILAKIGNINSPSVEIRKIPDDPNVVFRLREEMKM